jgi:hypothetical protein
LSSRGPLCTKGIKDLSNNHSEIPYQFGKVSRTCQGTEVRGRLKRCQVLSPGRVYRDVQKKTCTSLCFFILSFYLCKRS